MSVDHCDCASRSSTTTLFQSTPSGGSSSIIEWLSHWDSWLEKQVNSSKAPQIMHIQSDDSFEFSATKDNMNYSITDQKNIT